MTLEDMRREMMLNVKDLAGEEVIVLRDSPDFTMGFPLVVVDFMGPQRRQYFWLSATSDGHENWIMAERVNLTICTIQKDEGEDTSRLDLQEILDRVEFGVRRDWPRIARVFGCGIFYPESWMSTLHSQFYNEKRMNIAVLKVTLLEPRSGEKPFRAYGPPLHKVTADYKPEGGEFKRIEIQIDD